MVQPNKSVIGSLGQYVLLAVIFCAGFFGYVMHTTAWFRAIPGDLFDARFNSVILEHLFQWVQGTAPRLWSPAFFYPFENVLAFSDNHFGSGWVYILFRSVGLHREQAYLGWFVVGNLLNFCVSYCVLRRLGFSIVAAGAGAFVFAFGLPALLKEAHAQLIYRFAVPLSFLAYYQYLQSKAPTKLAQSVLWLAVQFYCSIYLGMFLAYLLAATTLAAALCQGGRLRSGWKTGWARQSGWQHAGALLLLLASVIGTGWLLVQYQSVSTFYGFTRPAGEILSMLPTPTSYLFADRSLLSGWVGASLPDVPMRHEKQMFFGIGLSLIALAGLWQAWQGRLQQAGVGRVASLALLVLMLLTLLVGQYSLYKVLLFLPGVSSIRAVARIVLVMLLPMGILAAIGFEWVLSRQTLRRLGWPVGFALIVLLTAETVYYQPYSTPIHVWLDRQAQFKALVPADPSKDAILFVTSKPGDGPESVVELDAMILAQDMGLPTLNGYSGNFPPGFMDPYPCVSFENRINSYFNVHPHSSLSAPALAKRVQLLARYYCPVTPALVTDVTIDQRAASGIKLGVQAELKPRLLYVTISITNTADAVFSTLSSKGPIRLSWRFVPLDGQGKPQQAPPWVNRKGLAFSLQKGQTDIEVMEVELPAQSGTYRFEISLVQDGVAWFHELGMETASQIVKVP